MVNMEATVISYLKQYLDESNPNSKDPVYFSTEQHFVKPLINSGVNNLEEQLLLGMNRIITKWTEDGTDRERIEFRKDDNDGRYYVLDSYIYNAGSGSQESDVFVTSNTLYFNDEDFSKPGPVEFDGDTLFDLPDNEVIMTMPTGENAVYIRSAYVSRVDILKYYVEEDPDLIIYDVAKKVTKVNFETVDGIDKTIIEEKITHYNYRREDIEGELPTPSPSEETEEEDDEEPTIVPIGPGGVITPPIS